METISFACKLFLSLSSFIYSCWKSFFLEILSFSKEWKLFFSILLEKIFFCHFCFDFKLFLLPAAAVRWRETIRKVCWKQLFVTSTSDPRCVRGGFCWVVCTLGYAVDGPSGLGQNGLEGLEAGLLGSPTYLASTPSGKRDCRSPASYPFHSVHPFHTISPISSIFHPCSAFIGFTDLFSEQKSGKPDCKSAAVAQ